jgi:hypothetical protein
MSLFVLALILMVSSTLLWLLSFFRLPSFPAVCVPVELAGE